MKKQEPKFGPTEFMAEIERLKAEGRMPSLEDVLSSVAEVRQEYAPRIIAERKRALIKLILQALANFDPNGKTVN